MAVLETVAVVTHVLFAGLWTGSVAFAAAVVAGGQRLQGSGRELLADRLKNVSRTSAVLMLLSGGYLASAYSGSYFMGTMRGYLLTAMVVLWVVLMVLVELAASRLVSDADRATTLFWLAGAVAVLLLLDAGLVGVL